MKQGLFITIFLFAVSLSGQAADLSLKKCAAIKDTIERLACYDTLSGSSSADTAKESGISPDAVDPVSPMTKVIVPDDPAVTPSVPAVKQTPDTEATFGLEHKQKPEKDRSDELQLKWTEKKKDAYGKWIITMENGQVWHQTDSKRFRFRNPEQRVIVSRGFLNGFFLREPESHTRIRIKRIK